MKKTTRRNFLKSTSLSALGLATLKAGLLFSTNVFAGRPDQAFKAEDPDQALATLFQQRAIEETDKVSITMPEIAEDGAIVPITIQADLLDIRSLSILSEKNPVSLIAQYQWGAGQTDGYIRTRIRLAESAKVIVVVDAGGQLCSARKYIKVVKGGCD